MDKRRFEYTGGTSSKFWEVWIEGNVLYCRWGRIGSKGQSKYWVFTGPGAARSEALQKAYLKLRKGYYEVFIKEKAVAQKKKTKPNKVKANKTMPIMEKKTRQKQAKLEKNKLLRPRGRPVVKLDDD